MGEANALEQAHEVEFALRTERAHDVFGGKVFDPDDEIVAQRTKFRRQAAPGGVGQQFKIGE